MLYNSEVWVIGKGEMKYLEGKAVFLMRKVAGKKVKAGEERTSSQQLREMLGLQSIREMIRKSRMQWVAHSARRGPGDLTWKGMRREVEDEKSRCKSRYGVIGESWASTGPIIGWNWSKTKHG